MANAFDDRFTPEPPRKSWVPTCLIGCLVLCVLGLCLCCGGFYWLVRNVKTVGTEVARRMLVSGIHGSELDAEEKKAIITQIDRLAEDYKSGQITDEEMGRILEELTASPLMGALILYGIERKYLDGSGLSADEKAVGRRTLQRALRGVLEGRIREPDLEPALNHVTTRDADGGRELEERVTDAELRAFLAACKEAADKTGVPDEPYTVKASEEFRRAVDRALKRNPPAAPQAEADEP